MAGKSTTASKARRLSGDLGKLQKVQTTTTNSDALADPFHKQFGPWDIMLIILMIILLIIAAYAAIKYNIVSTDEYAAVQQKYGGNTTTPGSISGATVPATIDSVSTAAVYAHPKLSMQIQLAMTHVVHEDSYV